MTLHVISPMGSLTMTTIGKTFQSINKIPARDTVRIDLEGVTSVDSSAVALLVAAVHKAKRMGQTVQIGHIPESVMQFAEIYGLRDQIASLSVGVEASMNLSNSGKQAPPIARA